MQITNTNVYGLTESKVASGLPLCHDLTILHYQRFETRVDALAKVKQGSGHDTFMKGIVVQMDVTAPLYWWKQAQRYHWFDFVSSQSTMHCITKFDIDKQCNQYVLKEILDILQTLIFRYEDNPTQENFQILCSNIPSGFMLTARITTNYLQLKTMYNQRCQHKHKLKEWQYFGTWCETLPNFKEWITNEKR